MAMLTARLLVVFLCSSVFLFCEFRPVQGDCDKPNIVGRACLTENLAYNQSIRANFTVVAGKEYLKKAVDGKPKTCFLEAGGSNKPVTVAISEKSLADVVTVLLDATLVNNAKVANASQINVVVYKDDGSRETPVANPNDTLITYHLSQAANVSRVDIRGDGNGALALCEVQVLTVCPSGTYGLECVNNCSAACVDDVCGRLSGYCTNGCKPDMDGTTECRKICEQGFYGDQCNQHCSKNCARDVCDKTSGDCLHGCKQGWTGDSCSTREVPNGDGGGGGAGIKASVLLAIAAAVSTLLQYC